MKTKLYYLTRTFPPYNKGGGPLMRKGAVEILRNIGWDVIVVIPNYEDTEYLYTNNMIQIPFKSKHVQKLTSILERLGIYEDYLDKWIDNALVYLLKQIKKNDIVFATSGGELGMIKLGSLLKNELACKFVVNFRDPLNYGYMNDMRRDSKFHIGREQVQKKYLLNSDLIITSSLYYENVLKKRFSELSNRIRNNYFGYIKNIDINNYKKKASDKLKIAYVGMMSSTQKPELLYHAIKELDPNKIEIYFIGNRNNYKPLQGIDNKNVIFINHLSHESFLEFMVKNIDMGFLSLVNDYYGACVPSKLYEYINLGLPILGMLPPGDANHIINSNKYGISHNYTDILKMKESIQLCFQKKNIELFKKNILKDKTKWAMTTRIRDVDILLESLIS